MSANYFFSPTKPLSPGISRHIFPTTIIFHARQFTNNNNNNMQNIYDVHRLSSYSAARYDNYFKIIKWLILYTFGCMFILWSTYFLWGFSVFIGHRSTITCICNLYYHTWCRTSTSRKVDVGWRIKCRERRCRISSGNLHKTPIGMYMNGSRISGKNIVSNAYNIHI